MNHKIIPIVAVGASKERKREAPKGRRVDPVVLADVQAMLGDKSRQRDLLIEHLHLINDRFGHLPAPYLAALAQEMRIPQSEVYEVATFYHHFEVVKEGEDAPAAITVRVCESLSCDMAGARDLMAKLPGILGGKVRVIPAPCVGRCEDAPAVVVGQRPVLRATLDAVKQVVESGDFKHQPEPYIDYAEYQSKGGYQLVKDCVSGKRDIDSVFKLMEHSDLRGMGGAGFPAGRKWNIVRAEPGPRLMAVNIDEGEPGTFKDRYYLERDPHRFMEGMLIAAWAVGIDEIYIYLRDEYHGCRELLEAELAKLKANPPIPDMPTIHLRRGAGAYICGEESAMIESIEGKRGMPRLRPPYVAQVGLFGRPTLEHNFETLHWVREILERGTSWFLSQGRHGSKGLRSFSVSGRVKNPGMKLAPSGITVTELINEYCGGMKPGHKFYAYLPGGASGGILPATMGDIPLDFGLLQAYDCFIGSAAVIVLSDKDTAVEAARNTMNFFKHESCGQCTPCREGTSKSLDLISQEKWDVRLLNDLSGVMRDASICGLGQAAPNNIDCVIKYFPEELN